MPPPVSPARSGQESLGQTTATSGQESLGHTLAHARNSVRQETQSGKPISQKPDKPCAKIPLRCASGMAVRSSRYTSGACRI